MTLGRTGSKIYLFCGILFTGIGLVFFPLSFVLAAHMDELIAYSHRDVEILPFIFGLIGGVMLLVGVILLIWYWRSGRIRRLLLERGKYVIAEITGFPIDYSIRVNGRPTYQIECSYPDPRTKKTYVFQSDNITIDPSRFINQKTVRVFVDQDTDFRNYYVDIAPLLKKSK